MLLETKEGFEDAYKHAGDGEQGGYGLEVSVEKLMDSNPRRPFTLVIFNLLQDGVVASAEAHVASEALEEA